MRGNSTQVKLTNETNKSSNNDNEGESIVLVDLCFVFKKVHKSSVFLEGRLLYRISFTRLL